MGVAFQLYAVDQASLDRFASDANAADEFCQARYCVSVPGESLWIDKSGLGILEAVGVLAGNAAPPAGWVLGDAQLQVGDVVCPFLSSDQVAAVSAWITSVSDDDFVRMVASNEIDNDAEYLSRYFSLIREFYADAATRGLATLTYVSG